MTIYLHTSVHFDHISKQQNYEIMNKDVLKSYLSMSKIKKILKYIIFVISIFF